MQTKDIITISVDNPLFPQEFKDLPIKNKLNNFYISGDQQLLRPCKRVGIIGSRHATAYGREVTRHIIKAMGKAEVTIVSGMAIGLDAIAHRSALEYGVKTIAVLPSNLRDVYPASHYSLAHRIIEAGGLLLSEYNHNERPMRHHFIHRNRLIAALSDVVLVVESAVSSGTKHTVDAGIILGKEVAAVPGSILSPYSDGTNKLIKDGVHIITDIDDLLMLLKINERTIKPVYHAENKYEAAIIKALTDQNLLFSELLNSTELDTVALNVHLTMLEIRGIVERISNAVWKLA